MQSGVFTSVEGPVGHDTRFRGLPFLVMTRKDPFTTPTAKSLGPLEEAVACVIRHGHVRTVFPAP